MSNNNKDSGDRENGDSEESLPPIFEGLPARPLESEAITFLQKHDDIDSCFPVYRLVNAPEDIVGVLVKTENSTSLALYNPERGVWEKVFETDVYDSAYSEEALDTRETLGDKGNRAIEIYGDNVEFIKPGESELFNPVENTFTGLLSSLPDSPVPRSTLVEFKREPEVVEVVPHVYHRESREILLFTSTFEELIGGVEKFGIAFFDRDAEEWVPSFTMESDRLEDSEDTEFEDAFDEAYDAVLEAYDESELGVLTDKADYDDWWIPNPS